MKNISTSKLSVWVGLAIVWLLIITSGTKCHAQSNWTNVGTTLQQRVNGTDTLYRIIKSSSTYGASFAISSDLAKKLNIKDSIAKYVTPTQLNAAIAAQSVTASNGLTKTANDIQLGGSLNASAVINLNGSGKNVTIRNTGADGGIFTAGSSGLTLGTTGATGSVNRSVSMAPLSGNMTVTDGVASKGFVNAADYSANFENESLITKRYSDLKIPLTQKATVNGVASLDGSGKVPLSQINDALLGAVNYQGAYNVATNTPTLPTAATSNKGWYYKVSDIKTVFQGDSVFTGDWIISNGVVWDAFAQNRPETDPIYNAQKSTLAKTDGSNATGEWNISITGTSPWVNVLGKPTTIAGYGITNAYTKTESDGKYPLKDGTGSSGTWPIGITGNAATATDATKWNGKNRSNTAIGSGYTIQGLYAQVAGDDTSYPLNDVGLRAYIGIPSGGETLPSIMARGSVSPYTLYINGNSGSNPSTGIHTYLTQESGRGYLETYDFGTSTGQPLFINPNGGNVGIGTTSPSAKLDVNGTGNFTGEVSINSGGAALTLTKSSNNKPAISFNGATSSTTVEAGDDFTVYTDGLIRQTITKAGATTFSGNLSAPTATIGTTTIGGNTSNVEAQSSHLILRPVNGSGSTYFQNSAATVNWGSINNNGWNGDVVGNVTGAITLGNGTFAASAGQLYNNATSGTVLGLKAGSSTDFAMVGPAGNFIMSVPTGTSNVAFPGNITAPYLQTTGPVVDSDPIGQFMTRNGTDNYLRVSSVSAVQTKLFASPALTGTPTAPTATAGTNTTQLATTAFVQSAIIGVSGATPTISIGVSSVVGTGATISIVGNNVDGIITLNTGTGITSGGGVFSVTFGGGFSYGTQCVPILQNNISSSTANVLLGVFTQTSNSWSTMSGALPGSSLSASTTYKWNYHVGGY